MDKSHIQKVILVGGSSRIAKINTILQNTFPDISLCKDIDYDKAITKSAAIYANILLNTEIESPLFIEDITPFPLGVRTFKNEENHTFSVVLQQYSIIPCSHTRMFTTAKDNATTVYIEIYEGESKIAEDNQFLG
ncbi:heat shock 70 kDa protein-like [Trichogramma pretiosum]|uniref:heat shock 70 kDa protein-like n=1 Tax=Trichogramma pretiosum TaxID=7493 RepID=UPI000C718C80|nr:heat shock 70 kDa protein-like [Trichogramma pretiosum]